MQAQNCAHILTQAYIALTLLLTMVNTAAGRRPAGHNPPSPSHGCDQTITHCTTGATPPRAVAPSSQHPIFTSQGPIGQSGSWLRALMQPGALRPGTVTVVDEQFHGKKEFGLPLVGNLQGVLVTRLEDNSIHIVAVKASFAVNGAEDSLRFFGVHHDDQEESHIAVVGGTGRYYGASGFAVVRAADVPETGKNVRLSRALSLRVHLR